MRIFQGMRWIALAVLLAWGTGSDRVFAQSEDVYLLGSGATFPSPLYQKWIEEFEAANPSIDVDYDAVGSGSGIDRFVTGSVDFGGSDRAISDEDIAKVERGVQLIPATAGMVALAYNLPDIGGPLRLPRDILVGIFNGEVTEWDDERILAANPDLDLPGITIFLIGRRDSSGTTFAFTNHLSAIDPAWAEGPGTGMLVDWPGQMMRVSGNDGVAQRIKIGEGAMGYVEYGFARRLGLPMAILENKAGGFVSPDATTGQAALDGSAAEMPENLRLFIADPAGQDSYPIVTYSWLMLYGRYEDETKKQALDSFVSYGLTEGQQFADELGYIPLPDKVVQLAMGGLKNVQ